MQGRTAASAAPSPSRATPEPRWPPASLRSAGAPLPALPDADGGCIPGAATGSAQAFALFYDDHAAAVSALARRLLRGGADVDDVVQETFLTAWRGADGYDAARGPARNWLLGIVRHRAIDAMRRRRVREQRAEALRRHAHGIDLHDADEEWLGRLDRPRIRAAIAALPDKQREVVALSFYLGLSHSAIAERLDAPLGTIKGRMRLGMRQLAHDPRIVLERPLERLETLPRRGESSRGNVG